MTFFSFMWNRRKMPSYLSVYFSVEMLFCQFEKLKNTSVLSAFNRVEMGPSCTGTNHIPWNYDHSSKFIIVPSVSENFEILFKFLSNFKSYGT